ncbi:MAG TPA: phosphoribosylformylglycinamidine cyclo-ligase [Planctomycetota bacterium]|nr:phosphoribosylformylglycinamidine cyclo-ligase [Planctomycetota bacterium]
MTRLTYQDAGVDVRAKASMLAGISASVRSTFTDRVLNEPGAFAGLFRASFPGMSDPVLVATNDGVGTKTKIARRVGRHRGIGADIVGHCINDALVQGAEPLFFLDYFAASKLDPAVFEEVVAGAADACREHGIALLGGETAEMPDVYVAGEYDFAGFLVGVVDRAKIWPRGVAVGDALVGVASSGLHTNGFSLVNRLADRGDLDLARDPGGLGSTLGEALLVPHRPYLRALRALRGAVDVHGLSHITGGAFKKNLPRVLPAGVRAVVDLRSWTPPPLFRHLAAKAGLTGEEPYDFLNMGCGLVVIVPPAQAKDAIARLTAAGETAWALGRLEAGEGVRFA